MSLVGRARRLARDYVAVPRARRRARRLLRGAETAEAAVAAARTFASGSISIRPVQVPGEIERLAELVRQERPRRVLEIGTWKGGTLFVLAWAAGPDATVITVDACARSGTRLGAYAPFGLLCRAMRRRGQRVVPLIRHDSHDPATRAEVERVLRGEPLDVLFIDGDHRYDGVRRDFELYVPLVRAGGLVVLHDIVDGPEGAVGGVPRFWREIKPRYEVTEIVESWEQGGFGIGVLRMPNRKRIAA